VSPYGALAALASFVRERLSTGGPSTVIVTASAPFAQTSYGRARLLRQLYASGLLSAGEQEQFRALAESAAIE
jgi:hypothetical protein